MAKARKGKAGVPRKGSVRERREAEVLRRFLSNLPDSGNAQPGKATIETYASKWNVASERLRDYRDGSDEALGRETVSILNTLLGRNEDPVGMLGVNMDDSLGFADPSNGGWYGAMLAEESIRQARLRTYQLIDRTRPEAHSALNSWSDLGITGNIGEDTRYGGGFEPVVYNAAEATVDAMKKVETLVNGRLLPDDQKLLVFYGMAKYGDQWGELGLVQKGGRFEIDRLTPRHARTMYVHRADLGKYDPNYAYKQILPGKHEPIAKFPEWKIAHFSNTVGWGDVYGESLFEPCLRSYIQIESMEAAMIIRRLERASLKLKHIVDVGLIDGGDDAMRKFVNEYRRQNRKIRTVDGTANFRMQKISMPPEEDVIIPKRDKDSPADVSVMQGDEYIENIGDFLHFWKKWMSGLGVPSAHLGYEDESSKTGVNDKHIVFARRVRRMQMKFISGLNHLYWVSLILRGIDPRTVRYTIFPPAMGTRDELIRAQIQLARATTIQYLSAAFSTTGKVPSVAWFLKYVLGMDDEVIEQLDLQSVVGTTAGTPGFKNAPPKNVKDRRELEDMAAVARSSPEVARQVEQIQFVLAERAMEMRLPQVGEQIRRSTMPAWNDKFETIVRSMGIKELQAA